MYIPSLLAKPIVVPRMQACAMLIKVNIKDKATDVGEVRKSECWPRSPLHDSLSSLFAARPNNPLLEEALQRRRLTS